MDVSTVAFAAEHHEKALAGLILGTYALGSATGGLWYGARRWQAPLHRRFLITLAGMVLGVAPLWALPSVPVLFGVIFFSGLSIAPTLIGGFSLIERKVPRGLLTEGMTLLSTAIGVGLAVGPAGRRAAHRRARRALGLRVRPGLRDRGADRGPDRSQAAALTSPVTAGDAGPMRRGYGPAPSPDKLPSRL